MTYDGIYIFSKIGISVVVESVKLHEWLVNNRAEVEGQISSYSQDLTFFCCLSLAGNFS